MCGRRGSKTGARRSFVGDPLPARTLSQISACNQRKFSAELAKDRSGNNSGQQACGHSLCEFVYACVRKRLCVCEREGEREKERERERERECVCVCVCVSPCGRMSVCYVTCACVCARGGKREFTPKHRQIYLKLLSPVQRVSH